jgi:hypothetical protein
VTDEGLIDRPVSAAELIVSVEVMEDGDKEAVILTAADAGTGLVEIVKVAVVDPLATVTLDGTVA